MHLAKELKPLMSKMRPSTNDLKEPTKESELLAKPLALKGGPKKLAAKSTGGATLTWRLKMEKMLTRETVYFGESLDRRSFRSMLSCIKMDMERTLKWLDSVLSPCVCGLMGPAPKPLNEVPCVPKPNSKGSVVNAGVKAREDKGKAKMGIVVPWLEFSFKPKFCKWFWVSQCLRGKDPTRRRVHVWARRRSRVWIRLVTRRR